jgi:hypothetical protein
MPAGSLNWTMVTAFNFSVSVLIPVTTTQNVKVLARLPGSVLSINQHVVMHSIRAKRCTDYCGG